MCVCVFILHSVCSYLCDAQIVGPEKAKERFLVVGTDPRCVLYMAKSFERPFLSLVLIHSFGESCNRLTTLSPRSAQS